MELLVGEFEAGVFVFLGLTRQRLERIDAVADPRTLEVPVRVLEPSEMIVLLVPVLLLLGDVAFIHAPLDVSHGWTPGRGTFVPFEARRIQEDPRHRIYESLGEIVVFN